jgi:hypothetical protein
MTAIVSSVLIGSFTLAANATLVVNGNNTVIAAGDYYLRDPTAANSLVDEIEAAVDSIVPGSTVYIGKDRLLRIVSGGGALTLSVPASLREVLGLVAAPTVGTTVVGTSISTLLWSPGWPETPVGMPAGVEGRVISDRTVNSSATGLTVEVTEHHSMTMASWNWTAVPQDRAWTSAEDPGEFVRFREDVLIPGFRFKLYSQVSEDSASSSAITWPSPPFGPYIAHTLPPEWYDRFVPNSDAVGANIDLEAIKTSEL